MNTQAITIAVFLGLGILFWMVVLGVSFLARPRTPSVVKEDTYECGLKPIGHAWYQVHVRYYLYALLFVIFAVEVALLYPWAVIFRRLVGMQWLLLTEVVIFLAILVFGLVYAWRKGALEWE